MNRIIIAVTFWVFLGLKTLGQGTTQTVFPYGYEGIEGNGSDSLFLEGDRQQWIQSAYLAEVWTQPVLISEMAFRVNGNSPAFQTTMQRVEIWFGITQFEGNFLNGEPRGFESNVGDTARRVFAADRVVIDAPGGVGANPFAIHFSFDELFYYDPNAGHLMFHVVSAGGVSPQRVDRQHFNSPPPMSIPGLGPAGTPISAGIVTRFTWTAVPEPTTASLFIVALAFICLRRNA